jgi:hypothetical protein
MLGEPSGAQEVQEAHRVKPVSLRVMRVLRAAACRRVELQDRIDGACWVSLRVPRKYKNRTA